MVSDEHVNKMVYCVDLAEEKPAQGVLSSLTHSLISTALVLHGDRATIWPAELVFPSKEQAAEALKHARLNVAGVPAEVSGRQSLLRDH